MSIANPAEQVGRRFPGGRYTIDPWKAWLIADTVLAEPPTLTDPEHEQTAHPLFAWLAATGGMGMTWDDLFVWFDASAADGPMFGEHETTLHQPLRVGATYRISGGIVSADRKVGRRAGTFDVIGYAMDLHDERDDSHAASCWNSLVLPRRNL